MEEISTSKNDRKDNSSNDSNSDKSSSKISEETDNNNIQDENTTTSIISNPIELSNIHQSRFLLDCHNVYIILLIFKKEKENLVENSPFPTGLKGIPK